MEDGAVAPFLPPFSTLYPPSSFFRYNPPMHVVIFDQATDGLHVITAMLITRRNRTPQSLPRMYSYRGTGFARIV